ncbi:CHAD domain-containing protein [Neorhizobium sp. P12A]|jgi:CHAD domain-containing protein|uniref:CHAD domain-containing protein n=1 Tax=Rhizobium/Agrobacterium group TaxID=227290 RepID=UPI0010515DDF|nr:MULTISPECIES: CHAD domain-containing protein [Rhizobium/Agrobacterium group]KAA0701061.1 CHAD domain-containing protein [Neorhizobium sp. P12A]TCR78294.1 CHAD domain-containing protein [Rhizobium sp. BK376]
MSFRIEPGEAFTLAFRNAAASQLQHAITTLEERPDGSHEAVHAFRKNLKRVRSLYRLVARAAPDFRKRENERLRDAAKELSAIRDATALIGTAKYLRDNARGPEEAEALGRIVAALKTRRDWLAEAESGLDQKLLHTADILREAIAALDDVSFDDSHHKVARMLAKSWRKTMRRAQAAIGDCHGEASAEAFHELRKRTQDYRQYQALLHHAWPSAMKAKRTAGKQLADLLGHVHDLDVLSGLVEAEPQLFSRNDDLAHLLDAIIARQQETRRQALLQAEAVFADDPEAESERIELLWVLVGN